MWPYALEAYGGLTMRMIIFIGFSRIWIDVYELWGKTEHTNIAKIPIPVVRDTLHDTGQSSDAALTGRRARAP